MKTKLLLTLIVSLLLTGCGTTPSTPTSTSFDPTEVPTEVTTSAPSIEPTITPTEEPTDIPTEAPTLEPTITPTEVPTEAPTETPTEIPTEVPTITPTEEPTKTPTDIPTEVPTETPTEEPTKEPTEEPTIPARNESLPIGNKSVSGPANINDPIDISEWVNFDFYNSLPDYWSYIQGNNKIKNCSDFYAESAGGGFKFSKLYYGLQSPLLTQWVKTEVRLSISKVANNSQKKDDGEPIFHIYGYDSDGYHIHTQYLEQGQITAKSEGNEVKFYIRNENVSYFELRLNAYPYKSSQCYNFGIDEISIKGWQWE